MNKIYNIPVFDSIAKNAFIKEEQYIEMYKQSIEDPSKFWGEQGKNINWTRLYSKVKNTSFMPGNISIRWYEDGELNLTINCLDRHLQTLGDHPAVLWESDDSNQSKTITFRQLYRDVCKFANILTDLNIKKGDVVAIYMPVIPEVAIAMLGCARIGAIHSVISSGFSPESIANRIIDSKAKVIITTDGSIRGGRNIFLKNNVDEAINNPKITSIKNVIVFKHKNIKINWYEERDLWWHNLMAEAKDHHDPVIVGAEHPLFILYTSGSTDKPKGVLHTTGGYLVYVNMTFKYTFDYHAEDIYWCTADVGWITGHSYLIYGPLSCGATILMFEGIPNWPKPSRMAEIIDKYKVTLLYTAPTVIRGLMAKGDKSIMGTNRSSLRILGSVGEPINPEAWSWYYKKIGLRRCPIVDTWWQTETGGFMITPLPGATILKAGSVTKPFFGIQPKLMDNHGHLLEGVAEGNLVIADSWPGQARTLFGDHQRFEKTYFSVFKNYYFSGDRARRDKDNYYWITGRVDDVINVSGHRLGTVEIESALMSHPKVVESAVVGVTHDIKGQAIYAYITLSCGEIPSPELHTELCNWVRKQIGPIATPNIIHWTNHLPKTRSGKIMRRVLRKIAAGETKDFGDISTLADPEVVKILIEENKHINNKNR